MPFYKHGKLVKPLMISEFMGLIDASDLPREKALLVVFLYYTGVRVSEALRMRGRDFYHDDSNLYCHVGKRLKHGLVTKDLPLPLGATYIDWLKDYVAEFPGDARPWRFGRKSAYRACQRLGFYPHYLRFNRATAFAREGHELLKIKAWFGWVKAETAMSYIGELDIADLGESLLKG